MGKHKRDKISKAVRSNPMSRNSLEEQIVSQRVLGPDDSKTKTKQKHQKDVEDPEFMDERMTQKILKEARKQQQGIIDDELAEEGHCQGKPLSNRNVFLGTQDSDVSDDDEFAIVEGTLPKDISELEIDPAEEKALELFMKKDAEPMKNLGNLIMEKFTEKKTELESQFSEAGGITMHELHPKVKVMYEGVRDCLKIYRSGQLPKAFKIIPRLVNWEQILHITEPESWTAAAMYQATRIFASNLKEKMAQRFFNLVLLPRIRDDITQYKKLNFHLYQALRKALFKPAAFMKGILIPLCESGTCTLREAVIIGSVLAKNSIPVLHSSAAMLMIAEMDYSGANSIFLKFLIDKRYALPYRVIDSVVYHFLKFEQDKRELPVLWHQSFLTFIQRYKEYLSAEQKDSLQSLLRAHPHYQISPEIRRELLNSRCREEMQAEEAALAVKKAAEAEESMEESE